MCFLFKYNVIVCYIIKFPCCTYSQCLCFVAEIGNLPSGKPSPVPLTFGDHEYSVNQKLTPTPGQDASFNLDHDYPGSV